MNAAPAPRSPARRFFLRAGLAAGGALALFGGVVFVRRGISGGRLTDAGREVLRGVARGVLADLLPTDDAALEAALDRHVLRMEEMMVNLPVALRVQVSALLGSLGTLAGRVAMTGMSTNWADASPAQAQAALEHIRTSPLPMLPAVYSVLRDLTTLNFFTDSANWKLAGYPGPLDV